MSPEQVRGEELDARTDLFSFGVVLYEIVTGVRPFRGETSGLITLEAILNRRPVAPVRLNLDLSAKLEEVINKALEKDKKLRYQSAAEIRTDLQRLKRDSDLARLPAATGPVIPVGEQRGKLWKVVVPTALVVATLAAAGYFHFHRTPKLTDKDTIVLTDFTNTTGDPVFDGTLRQGLSVQLEESPFLSIIPDQGIQQTLRMMGQKPDAKLTPEIARELCQRTGGAAVLDGSIAQIGTQYLLTLKAVKCATGETLASAEAKASDKGLSSTLWERQPRRSATSWVNRSTRCRSSIPHSRRPPHRRSRPSGLQPGAEHNAGKATPLPPCRSSVGLQPRPEFRDGVRPPRIELRVSGPAQPNLRESHKAYELRERVSEQRNSTSNLITTSGSLVTWKRRGRRMNLVADISKRVLPTGHRRCHLRTLGRI